jgi:hypothetical protein
MDTIVMTLAEAERRDRIDEAPRSGVRSLPGGLNGLPPR